jgi:5-methylcytosine-specific restriction enzyme subunit McrC
VTAPVLWRDLSPYPGELIPEDHDWLQRLSRRDIQDFVVRVGSADDADEWSPIVERRPDGRWWAGRYIGALTFEGRRLIIEPRLGVTVIEAWLDQIFGLLATPASAQHTQTESFIVRLLARLWCRTIDAATRHGLPLLRLPRSHEGLFVRGRFDVARTTTLMGEGRQTIASITHDRSLSHPVTRAIVCADRALGALLTDSAEWRTERVRQTLPPLRGAVGARPRLPSIYELSRVRYTPITLPFRRAAILSHRIASRLGYGATEDEGNEEGVLIDVAELWELFVLNCVRHAAPGGLSVEHGTHARRRDFFLRGADDKHEIGRLKPDILVLDGEEIVAVIDAKYKLLANSREQPTGVDPADLYQIVAYSMRFKPTGVSALIYPMSYATDQVERSYAERFGPWHNESHKILFARLPTDVNGCREAFLTQGLLTRPLAARIGAGLSAA